MKIEGFGNTKEQAEFDLEFERKKLPSNIKLEDVKCYGNFEIGYKIIQEYKIIDE
ncbi:MAG: hypothetical protein WC707_07075 [Candidatus Babeliaceae bacterium]|jgi:hypothetical protein